MGEGGGGVGRLREIERGGEIEGWKVIRDKEIMKMCHWIAYKFRSAIFLSHGVRINGYVIDIILLLKWSL